MDDISGMLLQLLKDHIIASHSIAVTLAVILARVDTLIRIALRFVPPEMLKAAIDRIEQRIDARIDKVAGVEPPAPKA